VPGARANYTRYPRAILWLIRGGPTVKSFYLSKLPISNVQYEAFDGAFERAPSGSADDDPAVGIDFERARAYCAWYAEISRKKMRLPTELEWEYACRGPAGATNEPDIPHAGNSGDRMPLLKKTRTNASGLHAMLGGVWEWTDSGVLRGGSYRTPAGKIGCALRLEVEPDYRADDVGFRIARTLQDRE
jgi:formylglycine-generating enzyme required for sulfatase activity